MLLVQFLLRVLTGWVQAIDEGTTPLAALPPPIWPQLCEELAPLLQVNTDVLRRHLVCELYSQGLDLRAEEVRDGCGFAGALLPRQHLPLWSLNSSVIFLNVGRCPV